MTTVKNILNFDIELTAGKLKEATAGAEAKSRDLWYADPRKITVLENFNGRIATPEYEEGIVALAQDMLRNGFYDHKPLSVFVATVNGEQVLYLAEGHRRLAAVLYAINTLGAEIEVVPFVTSKRSANMEDLTTAMVKSNEGQPFTTLELALICKRYDKYGRTPSEIADLLGKTPEYIDDLLLLSGAPRKVLDLLVANKVSASLVIETIKKYGDGTLEVLQGAVGAAIEAGKAKATKKDIKADPEAELKKREKKLASRLFAEVIRGTEAGEWGISEELEKILFAREEE